VRHCLLAAVALLCAPCATAVAAQSPRMRNPSHNRPPSRATLVACLSSRGSPGACDAHALADIDRARRGEDLAPMTLPGDYKSLSVPERLLAIADLERVDRRLAPVTGLTRALNAAAREGAVHADDPFGPEGYAWGSNWAGGTRSPLFDDFVWMYDDSLGSGNIACNNPETAAAGATATTFSPCSKRRWRWERRATAPASPSCSSAAIDPPNPEAPTHC
jgi:hypothetical protein